MTTKVHIENVGTFYIDPLKLNELVSWLRANQVLHGSIKEISSNNNDQLING